LFKIIIKGALRGLAEVMVSIVIPIYVIYTLATRYLSAIPEAPLIFKEIRPGYSIEEIIIVLVFLYVLIAIIEEHETWRTLGAALKIFIMIAGFLVLYTLLGGGILNYSGVIEGYEVIATVNISIFMYLYGILVVFPAILASIMEIVGKASGTSE